MSSSTQAQALDSVDALYQQRHYPPMSHPVSDPALSAVAAWIAGLKTPPPAGARILEIGCGSGHNLIPLAQRWPRAQFLGVDISADVVALASQRAAVAGVENLQFLAADLRTLDFEGGTFDYIIAHGFISWVSPDVQEALFRFCARHLSATGIATLSFNVMAGWEQRLPVIEMARKISEANQIDEVTALEVMREASEDEHLKWMLDDMLAKGPEILAFDDFAPVNDPWTFEKFAKACTQSGLRWLGESDPAENIPSSLDQQAREALMALVGDPLQLQMTADDMAGTSFRSGVVCREDAPLEPVSTGMVMEFSVRELKDGKAPAWSQMERFLKHLKHFSPRCVPVPAVLERFQSYEPRAMAKVIFDGITRGEVSARIEPQSYDSRLGEVCRLNEFRLLCAREKLPLVDAWHVGCAFPEEHYAVLAAMDGTKSIAELRDYARGICPELAFDPWLQHLADRGMFA